MYKFSPTRSHTFNPAPTLSLVRFHIESLYILCNMSSKSQVLDHSREISLDNNVDDKNQTQILESNYIQDKPLSL